MAVPPGTAAEGASRHPRATGVLRRDAVAPESAQRAVDVLQAQGIPAWVAGEVTSRSDDSSAPARLVGSYR